MNGIPPTNPGTASNATHALDDYINLANQLRGIIAILSDLKGREANHSYMEQYSNTVTYSVNPDGSAGVNDPVPDPSHPMVGQAISANEVQGFMGYVVNDLMDFLTGIPGPTVSDRRPAIYGMLP